MRRLEEHELHDEAAWRALLGAKVSLRYRIEGDSSHPFSEAIGVVQSVAGGAATIVGRRGNTSRVPLADILAGKVFSP